MTTFARIVLADGSVSRGDTLDDADILKMLRYVREHGEDMPQIRNWTWPYGKDAEASG